MRSSKIKEIYERLNLIEMDNLAKSNNVYCDLVELKSEPTLKTDGIYFVVTPDLESIQKLADNPSILLTVMNGINKLEKNCYSPYCTYNKYISTQTPELFLDTCIENIQAVGFIKAAFHECKKSMPIILHNSEYQVLNKLNEKRYDTFYAPLARQSCDELFKETVNRYSKRSFKSRLTYKKGLYVKLHELFGSQRVNYSYFEKNQLDIKYINIDKKLYNYFKKEIKQHPYVKYFKTSYKSVIKDHRYDLPDEYDSYNINHDEAGSTNYCIGINSSHYDLFLKIAQKYEYKDFKIPKTIEEFQNKYVKPYEKIDFMRVSNSLIDQFYMLCQSDRVHFMIDTEGEVTNLASSNVIVVYNTLDKEKIDNVLKKIIKIKETTENVRKDMMEKAKQNAPKFVNPLFAMEAR